MTVTLQTSRYVVLLAVLLISCSFSGVFSCEKILHTKVWTFSAPHSSSVSLNTFGHHRKAYCLFWQW